MKPEKKLLRRIAAIPAGDKLPIARFSRELNCSQSVTIAMVQGLIAEGSLDAATVRPPVIMLSEVRAREATPASKVHAGMSGAQIRDLILAETKVRNLSLKEASLGIWGNASQFYALSTADRPVLRKTLEKVAAWLGTTVDETPEELPPAAPGGAAAVPAAGSEEGARSAPGNPPVLPVDRAPSDLDTASGSDLALALRLAARVRGQSITDLLLPVTRWPQTWLSQLEKAKRPKRKTVERVKALLGGETLPPREERQAYPNQNVRRVDREAAGLPPSARELAEMGALRRQREEREAEDERAEAAERAKSSRRPGESLADAVRREALAVAARRKAAGVPGGVHKPLEAIEIEEVEAREGIGELTADRRERELRDVASPSALIRRATKEWPDKCNKVAGLAARMGVQLGEAWQRVIDAGVMTVSEDLLEDGI